VISDLRCPYVLSLAKVSTKATHCLVLIRVPLFLLNRTSYLENPFMIRIKRTAKWCDSFNRNTFVQKT